MTNDTNTLNGALQELGETMADNLTTMGVPSTYDEGLTTLAGKILDITPGPGPTPTPASISLTADKSILSYADTESAVLTATVLDSSSNPVEGVSVDLYKDSVLWDTLTTGSAGTVSKTYTSAGVGDVGFTAECGSLVSKTFVIQDTWKYDPSTYSSNKVYNLQLPSSKYSLEFDLLKKGTSDGSAGGVVLGTDSNYFMVGCGSSTSYQVARWGTNVSYVNLFSLTHNTWKTIVLEVDGGTVDIKANGNTYTISGISTDITSLLYRINCNNSNINIRNLKIKPL